MLAILQRCLNSDPGQRPTATELVQLLTAAPNTPPPGITLPLPRRSVGSRPPPSPVLSGAPPSRELSISREQTAGSGGLSPTRAASAMLPLHTPAPQLAATAEAAMQGRHSGDWGAPPADAAAPSLPPAVEAAVATPDAAAGGAEVVPVRPSLEAVSEPPISGSPPAAPTAPAEAAAGGAPA